LEESIQHHKEYDLKTAFKLNLGHFLTGAALRSEFLENNALYGTHIWDREWDVLVILDACRYDLMMDVAESDEIEWLTPDMVESHYSVGSHSREFIQRTFDVETHRNEMQQTSAVIGNMHTSRLSQDQEREFALLDEVWTYEWDDDIGIVPPDKVIDRGIDVARNSPTRTLV